LAEARNSALHDCRAPVIAYLDDDAVAEPDWLEMLVAGFERIEDLGALGGRVDPIWEVPAPAWLPRSMYGYLSVVDWGDEVIDIGEAQWLAGTNIALRVAPVRRIGGFRCHLGRRPGVLLGNEETELCQRLTQAGLRVVYDPAIEVRHLVSRERCSQAWIRRRVAWQAISNLMTEPQRTATTEWYRSCIEAYRGASADSGGEPETLTRDVPTAEMFEAQCRAVFAWTMLLAGVSNDLRKCA
jgi:GT2 family glycosyltransferase